MLYLDEGYGDYLRPNLVLWEQFLNSQWSQKPVS